MAYKVKIYYVAIACFVLATAISLLTSFIRVGVAPGVELYGFPIAWKTVYGKVTAYYSFELLFVNILIYWSFLFPSLTFVILKLGWKIPWTA